MLNYKYSTNGAHLHENIHLQCIREEVAGGEKKLGRRRVRWGLYKFGGAVRKNGNNCLHSLAHSPNPPRSPYPIPNRLVQAIFCNLFQFNDGNYVSPSFSHHNISTGHRHLDRRHSQPRSPFQSLLHH